MCLSSIPRASIIFFSSLTLVSKKRKKQIREIGKHFIWSAQLNAQLLPLSWVELNLNHTKSIANKKAFRKGMSKSGQYEMKFRKFKKFVEIRYTAT